MKINKRPASYSAILGGSLVSGFFFFVQVTRPARRCKVSSTLLANVIQPITSFCLHCFLRRAGRFHGRPNGDVPRLVLATTEFQLQLQAELLAD